MTDPPTEKFRWLLIKSLLINEQASFLAATEPERDPGSLSVPRSGVGVSVGTAVGSGVGVSVGTVVGGGVEGAVVVGGAVDGAGGNDVGP